MLVFFLRIWYTFSNLNRKREIIMALITCTNCGKEVSDKAFACPQCGQPIVPPVPVVKPLYCEDCGTLIPQGMDLCPNCGCPASKPENFVPAPPQKVEVTSVNLPKMKKNTKMYIIIAAVAVVAILAMILVGGAINKANQERQAAERAQQYAEDLETLTYTMLNGAAEAETAGNLIKSVWYNAIYEERSSKTDKYTRPNGYFVDDFNDALNNLFSDPSFRSQIQSIEDNQDKVEKMMKNMKNPPEEYEEAYEALKDYYEAYTNFTNLVTNPSGSLTTFSSNFNNADSEVLARYQAMKIYID